MGVELLPGKSSYFFGKDPSKWRTGVSSYAKVRYPNVWPGVDVIYYGNSRQLEYDFVLKPGVDVSKINLNFDGAQRVEIDNNGDLLIDTSSGRVRQHKPVVYQQVGEKRIEVAGGYSKLGQNRVGFHVSSYDHKRELIIDPTLVYSTFLGGSNPDFGNAIAVDSSGNAYITGYTQSTDFPILGSTRSPNFTITFVTKMNATGTALIYSAEVGGNGGDYGNAIAVDSSGNAYVAGSTGSTDFPAISAMQAAFGGTLDAFLFKLNASGTALTYSTYIGGSGFEYGRGVAVDGSGNAYVTGTTYSNDFPTSAGAFRPASSTPTGFVTKVNSTGTRIYSTTLDNDPIDFGDSYGIAADSGGNAYVTGSTGGSHFPVTTGAFQTVFQGGYDAFVMKLNTAGTGLVYSTLIGGSGADIAKAIAIDGAGNAYIAGSTTSGNFPLPQAGTSYNGGQDAFIVKLNTAGSALLYGMYIGGARDDFANSVAVDTSGNAYLTGGTGSSDFPLNNALQTATVGLDGPVFKTTNGGTSWAVSSSGLSSIVSQIVIDPATPATLYALGAPGIYKSTNGGTSWSPIGNLVGVKTLAIDPVTPSTVYASIFNTLYKSTDGGANWITVSNGLPGSEITNISIDPNNPAIIYVSTITNGVYVSSTSGASWSAANNGLPANAVADVSADPVAAGTAYAVANTGIYRTTNSGGLWSLVYSGGVNSPHIKATAARTAYAFGFNTTTLRTIDGGATWRSLSIFSVNAIVADPINPNRVYAATQSGVAVSTDGGNVWTRMGAALSSQAVMGLAIDRTTPANVYAVVAVAPVAFVAKVNPAGNAFIYSTYLAGAAGEAGSYPAGAGNGIAADASGNAYITGSAIASFPTTPGVFRATAPGILDAFVAKIADATGSCAAQLNPASSSVLTLGKDVDFIRVVLPSGCAWTATSSDAWLSITAGGSGTGLGEVFYTVLPNANTSARAATISVATTSGTVTYTVNQTGGCPAQNISLGQVITRSLTANSCSATFRGGTGFVADDFVFNGTAGQQIAILTSSSTFDTFLYLQDPAGNVITDADGGGGTNSRIPANSGTYTLPATGQYTIAVTSQTLNGVGSYTLWLLAASGSLPAAPVPVTPANGATGVTTPVTLTWNPSSGAVSYDVYFGTTSPPAFYVNTVSASVSPTGVAGNATYFWYVVAKNADGSTNSITFNFTTAPSGACTYTLSSRSATVTYYGFNPSPSVTVTPSSSSCAWTASTNNGFAYISSGSSGVGTGSVGYGVSVNNGGFRTGTLTIAGQTFTVNQLSTPVVFAKDFDGDGKGDLATFRPSTGLFSVAPSSNGSLSLSQSWGIPGDISLVGDFDGDGVNDYAVYRPSSGTWYIIPSASGIAYNQSWGIPGDQPVPGDYDADGKTDFAVYRPSTQTWFIIPSSNPTNPIVQSWGIPGDQPVQGDFDGDGKKDIAVYRPNTGQWFIVPSATPSVPYVRSWGIPGDVPVPGDFDADGKSDIAVYRPSTGTWFVQPSGTPGTQTTQSWGIPGDIPVLMDFDGDRKADYAIYRPSTQRWYIIQSSTGTIYQNNFGIANDIPLYRFWPLQ